MQRIDYIQKMDIEELSEFFCNLVNESAPCNKWQCEGCPVKDKCYVGTNGFKEWLSEEGEVNGQIRSNRGEAASDGKAVECSTGHNQSSVKDYRLHIQPHDNVK